MVNIARWNHDGGTQSGFVDGRACYALPQGQDVQTLLDAGLADTRQGMKVSLGPCNGKDFANTLGPDTRREALARVPVRSRRRSHVAASATSGI